MSSVDGVAAVPPERPIVGVAASAARTAGRTGAGHIPSRPEPASSHQGPERLLTARFWLVVASGTAYFLAIGMVLPVLPLYVERRLGGNSLTVGVVVGAFAFGAIALRPLAGRLGDQVGRRVLIAGGAAVAGVSTLLYSFAHGTMPLLGLRVLTGVGEAAFFVGASTMITDLAPAHRRGEGSATGRSRCTEAWPSVPPSAR